MYNLKIDITGKSIEVLNDALEFVKSRIKQFPEDNEGSDENSNVTVNYTLDKNDKELFDNEIEDDPYLLERDLLDVEPHKDSGTWNDDDGGHDPCYG